MQVGFGDFYIPNRSWMKKNDKIHRKITEHIIKITAHIYARDIFSLAWFNSVSLPLRVDYALKQCTSEHNM